MKRFCLLLTSYLTLSLAIAVSTSAEEVSDAQRAKDARIVQVLLRLENVDLAAKPEYKASLLRHMDTIKGSEKYFELVDRFALKETRDELLKQAIENPDSSAGVESARLLVKLGEKEAIAKSLAGDEPQAVKLIQAIGLSGEIKANDLLFPLVADETKSRGIRSAIAAAIGRNVPGQKLLLSLVEKEKLPADLNFTVGNALFASADPTIRTAASKYLKPPATANSEPLPPVPELAKKTGDAVKGKEIFANKGTCAKCHKVKGEGKDVGPDLSEIGSKLSKEAFYVSILDPSAGISHNYETFVVVTDDGNVVTGILVSDTAEAVTLKTAEALVRVFPKANIEELKKLPVSLMPADLQKILTVQELVDVVEYLTTLRKM